METKARISNISRDFRSGKVQMTFTLDQFNPEEAERLVSKDLYLTVKKYNSKTLAQNNYMWELLQKIADHVRDGSSRWEQYMRCIREYGIFAYYPAQEADIPLLESVFRLVIDRGELEIITPSDRIVKVHQMQCFKGTSCYTRDEMQAFLDKIVSECKQNGISVATPDELAYMRSLEDEINYSKR